MSTGKEEVAKEQGAAMSVDQGGLVLEGTKVPDEVATGIIGGHGNSSGNGGHDEQGSLEALTATFMAKFHEMYKEDEDDNALKTTIATENKLLDKAFCKFIPLLTMMISMTTKESRKDLKEDMKADMREVLGETRSQFKDEIKGELKPEIKEELKPEIKEELKPEIKGELKTEIKDEIVEEVKEIKVKYEEEIKTITQEAKNNINNSIGQKIEENVTLQKKITEKIVKCKVDVDKREAFERSNNIIFSGLSEDPNEKTNRGTTTQIVIRELEKVRCNISKDDLLCQRIFKRGAARNNGPPLIIARFASPIVKNKVMGFKQSFNNVSTGKFMNEDMTALQRSLFHYLRNKEDIVLKKSVGYKDGKVIFLLKRNESATINKWSYAHSILDLAKIDDQLKIDLLNEEAMKNFGFQDCLWATESN